MKMKIIELHQKGFTQQEISKMLNCSIRVVREVLVVNEYDTRKTIKISPEIKKNIETLVIEGYSYQLISDVLDVSKSTIKTVATNENLISKRDKAVTKKRTTEILTLYASGKTQKAISKELHILPSYVKQVLIDKNIIEDKKVQKEKAELLATQGYTALSISKYLRMSFRTVKNIIESKKIKTFSLQNDLPDRSNKQILELYYTQQMTVAEISRKLSLETVTINHIINSSKEDDE